VAEVLSFSFLIEATSSIGQISVIGDVVSFETFRVLLIVRSFFVTTITG